MKKGRIYTVHYGNNIEITQTFINSIKPFLSTALEVVIINNSKEIKIDHLESKFISIINAKSNLGYFGAAKYGIERFPIDNLDYIIICNNDIQIINADFFNILSNRLKSYDIIAPSIKTLEDIEQNPHSERYFSKFRRLYYQIYCLHYFIAFTLNKVLSLKKKSNKYSNSEQKERIIFSPHGAFLILNKTYFEKNGNIDDGYFLYGEENSIAAIALKQKMRIGFLPSLKVRHSESISTGKKFSKTKFKFQRQAYRYIKRTYPDFLKL